MARVELNRDLQQMSRLHTTPLLFGYRMNSKCFGWE